MLYRQADRAAIHCAVVGSTPWHGACTSMCLFVLLFANFNFQIFGTAMLGPGMRCQCRATVTNEPHTGSDTTAGHRTVRLSRRHTARFWRVEPMGKSERCRLLLLLPGCHSAQHRSVPINRAHLDGSQFGTSTRSFHIILYFAYTL